MSKNKIKISRGKAGLKIPAFWLVNIQLKKMKKLPFAFTLAIAVVFYPNLNIT